MSAKFREVLPASGVDEDFPGMIVPRKGSNVVMLADGAGLDVRPSRSGVVDVKKVGAAGNALRDALSKALPLAADPMGKLVDVIKAGNVEFFQVTGRTLGGHDGVTLEAVKPGASRPEASIKVLVLDEKPVKVAIRPVHHLMDGKSLTPHSKKAFDVAVLIQEMNAIWLPQANIRVTKGLSSAAPVQEKLPGGVSIDQYEKTFVGLKDSGAAFTMFLVERAVNNDRHPHGVSNPEKAFALLGDSRSYRTPAHELGHFLGSQSGPAGFAIYGHPTRGSEMLMNDQGSGGAKIPFAQVRSHFNGKY